MILSLDIGGTSLRAGLVSKTSIVRKQVIPTPKTNEDLIRAILSILHAYPKTTNIGISVAGFVDGTTIVNSPHLPLAGTNLASIIHKHRRSNVKVKNDAQCAGLAELKYGAGKEYSNFVVLSIGTGIGSAIIINKKLYTGKGMAGEVGHMTISNLEFEALASGTALQNKVKDKGWKVTPEQLELMARRGNAEVHQLYGSIGKELGRGLLNLLYTLDPQIFIIAGGLSNIPYILYAAQDTLHEQDRLKRTIPVRPSMFTSDAALIGASLLF